MKDTAISNNTSIIRLSIPSTTLEGTDTEIADLSKQSSKCPAVIFAINRTLSVRGRMRFLTNSIITINLIKGTGVPLGTK